MITLSADYIKHVPACRPSHYIKGTGFERVKVLLGNGIVVSSGDFWQVQPHMMQPAIQRRVIARISNKLIRSVSRKPIA